MSRDDEIVYASIKLGGYTYQAINQDSTIKEWMIRKIWDGGWEEIGVLKKDEGDYPSYFTNPLGGRVDGTITWKTAEEALRFAAGGFR